MAAGNQQDALEDARGVEALDEASLDELLDHQGRRGDRQQFRMLAELAEPDHRDTLLIVGDIERGLVHDADGAQAEMRVERELPNQTDRRLAAAEDEHGLLPAPETMQYPARQWIAEADEHRPGQDRPDHMRRSGTVEPDGKDEQAGIEEQAHGHSQHDLAHTLSTRHPMARIQPEQRLGADEAEQLDGEERKTDSVDGAAHGRDAGDQQHQARVRADQRGCHRAGGHGDRPGQTTPAMIILKQDVHCQRDLLPFFTEMRRLQARPKLARQAHQRRAVLGFPFSNY